MIDIKEAEREAWLSGRQKNLTLTFGNGISITNDDIDSESMSIEQTLCDENNIRYGKCSAAAFKVRISDTAVGFKGQPLKVSLESEGYSRKLGTYSVYSDNRTDDRRYRDIVAYDAIYASQSIDCTTWYDGLSFPLSMKSFRDSFFKYIGIEQEETSLPNDGMQIEKTINPSEISAHTIMEAICELNGRFGQINAEGKFRYVDIDNNLEALYPSENLYPADDLYPKDDANFTLTMDDYAQGSFRYEDYKTQKITKVTVREQDGDIGGSFGTDGNAYFITGNFLAYGQTQEALDQIAANIYMEIYGISYSPANITTMYYLPWVEIGDAVKVIGLADAVIFPILKRTISGITAAKDTYEAKGEETAQEGGASIVDQIIQLKGQSNTFYRDINETRSEIKSLSESTDGQVEELSTRITQNSQSIEAEARRAKGEEESLSARVTVNAESISSEVTRATKEEGTLSSRITQTAADLTSEITRSTKAEGDLSSRITQTADSVSSEVKRATEAEGTISNSLRQTAESLSSEITRATNEESSLSSRINQTDTDITAEVTRASKAEGDLSSRITVNANSISSEITRATNAEDSLSSRITQTSDSITAEVTRATSAESSLSGRIAVSAHTIGLNVSGNVGQNSSAGITISLYDENGKAIDSTSGNITLDGNVVFKSNLYDGTTTISGNNITTGTISADRLNINEIFAKTITATGSITGAKLYGSLFETVTDSEWGRSRIDAGQLWFYDSSGKIRTKHYHDFLTLYSSTHLGYRMDLDSSGIFIGNQSDPIVIPQYHPTYSLYVNRGMGYFKNGLYSEGNITANNLYTDGNIITPGDESHGIGPSSDNTGFVGTASNRYNTGYINDLHVVTIWQKNSGGAYSSLDDKYLGKTAKASSASTADSATYATTAGSASTATSATNATNSTNATRDSDGNQINTTYLKLSGGTMTGTIVTPANDGKGIEPASDNYGQIGSSSKKFYRGYFNTLYENGISLSSKYSAKLSSSGVTIVGTDNASLASGSWLSRGSFQLEAGTWLIIATVEFSSNSTGVRFANIGSSSGTSAGYNEYTCRDRRLAVTTGVSMCSIVVVLTFSYATTLYLNAYQNSGSSLMTKGRRICVKLS